MQSSQKNNGDTVIIAPASRHEKFTLTLTVEQHQNSAVLDILHACHVAKRPYVIPTVIYPRPSGMRVSKIANCKIADIDSKNMCIK